MCLRGIAFSYSIDARLLPSHFADALRRDGASDIVANANRVTFTRGYILSWVCRIPLGPGEVRVDTVKGCIGYRLNFWPMIKGATILWVFMAIWTFFVVYPLTRQPFAIVFVLFLWFYFVLGNAGIEVFLFRRFIRRTLATAPRVSQSLPVPDLS